MKGWDVIVTDTKEVHVLPCNDHHVPSRVCDCRPTPKRAGPLDDPIWNHHEPTWPGSTDYLQ